jgi:hypothetical protein
VTPAGVIVLNVQQYPAGVTDCGLTDAMDRSRLATMIVCMDTPSTQAHQHATA